jgi:CopG family nickel-responsive transcriptional regulator
MQRVTITLPDALCAEIDTHVALRRYDNRSEAVRDLLRHALREGVGGGAAPDAGQAMGILSYAYSHETRELSRRLMRHNHDHHALTVSTSHVHLDHDTCLETTILRGSVAALRAYADGVLGQRGVVHGNLFLIPIDQHDHAHAHGQAPGASPHAHLHVKDSF